VTVDLVKEGNFRQSIKVTSIYQNEKVQGAYDAIVNANPSNALEDLSIDLLASSGGASGRVYFISYTVKEPTGGRTSSDCTQVVTVTNQKGQKVARTADALPRYNSLTGQKLV
jgi:hypothetical protein